MSTARNRLPPPAPQSPAHQASAYPSSARHAPSLGPAAARGGAPALARRFAEIRARSVDLAQPLSDADCQVQSMPDASPTKWHLAHTTWFFETFVLERFEPHFAAHHPAYRVLFNSYYQGIGEQHPRPQRGLITRPGRAEIMAYRQAVDARVLAVLAAVPDEQADTLASLVELGLQHEQQHQELILTDIKHLLGCNPLAPVYRPQWPLVRVTPVPLRWIAFDGGDAWIGHDGGGFAFDNELPRHRVALESHALANRPVNHGEWAAFIDDGGYRDARWWLSAGWDWVRQQRIEAPLYWQRGGPHGADGGWTSFTLHGRVPIDPCTPVTHISLYEADAYARWRGAVEGMPLRLPTEAEWENAVRRQVTPPQAAANFVETGALHPLPPAQDGPDLLQAFGDVWEWTSSAYAAYPGYRPWTGAAGEYNGKFMINQTVLRGGSCATPGSHLRASYRNFFPAETRWQFSGLRLACDG